MAVCALAITEAVAHRALTASQALAWMTRRALEGLMGSLEWVGSQLGVRERLDLEGSGVVTGAALALRRGQAELAGVNVTVATRTFPRSPTISGPATARPVLLRRSVAAVAGGVCMRAGQWPNAVVDSGRVPSARGMALRTTALLHLGDELVAVRILVAVDATLSLELEVVARTLALVTTRAWNRLMSAIESELGATVLLHGEGGGPEAALVVTRGAVHVAEGAAVNVTMAVAAALELQSTIPAFGGQLWRVALLARHFPMRALEGKCGQRMGAKPNRSR